ncbi:glycosyltransferase family 4 protein [Thermopolyspora sp. NPDC052614]|uniref:glycosyltransferase family 4 protein n=1 Tax=Thermopolyspora sp. NPDC052614 TaxID=3155682 RepID=UPI00342A9B66
MSLDLSVDHGALGRAWPRLPLFPPPEGAGHAPAEPPTGPVGGLTIRYLLLHAYGMGGTIRTVFNQAGEMARLGHRVEIVSVVRRRDEPCLPLDPGVRLVTLLDRRGGPGGAGPAGWGPGRRALARLRRSIVPGGEFAADWFDAEVERAVLRYVSRLEDGVLVGTRPGVNLLIARAAGDRRRRRGGPGSPVLVAQEHMNLATHRPDVRAAIVRAYPRFDAVVVLTHADRRHYQGALPGTRVVRIPNAVRGLNQRVSRQTARTVVAAGRLCHQKGFDLLLPAFAKVLREFPDWRLRIYGTGPRLRRLGELARELRLGDGVRLMGRTDRLDERLAEASLFVLSSRFEGLPMVLIEAMSHGLPVVGFDCPTGPADVIVHGENGLLVPPEDVDGLAEAMITLIRDRELRLCMGKAALRTVADYSPAAVMPRWHGLFTELAARPAGNRPRA